MLQRLIYASLAIEGKVDFSIIEEILDVSQRNNKAANISGILLFTKKHFIQCLEGDTQALSNLYDRITRDRRHTDCVKLYMEMAHKRLFPSWTMAYVPFEQLSQDPVAKKLQTGELTPRNITPQDALDFIIAARAAITDKPARTTICKYEHDQIFNLKAKLLNIIQSSNMRLDKDILKNAYDLFDAFPAPDMIKWASQCCRKCDHLPTCKTGKLLTRANQTIDTPNGLNSVKALFEREGLFVKAK
ncbi:BLUF domain-containing protein [Magnetococcales bacterium HHB-1]